MPYNLSSRSCVQHPISGSVKQWFEREIAHLSPFVRDITMEIFVHYKLLCAFPKKPLLFWSECNRTPEKGKNLKYHQYLEEHKTLAKRCNVSLDTRPNGPAVAAFELAGGIRPLRDGSNNKWHVHHLYSGKFPYPGRTQTLHASKNGLHFTQAAGLIAVHPFADALCDESPAFAWFLRHISWKKFAYDPDHVFADTINQFGFAILDK